MTKRTAAMGPVEGPWVLPDGWQWEALGSLGTWSGGGTPSKTRPDFWTDGTIPWVSPKDMKRPLIDSSQDKITTAAVAGSSAKMVPAGSVLCVMRSGILRHTFPVAVNTIDVTLNQDMRALIPRLDVEPRYLAYFLQFTGPTVLHTASKAGTTVNSIEASRLNRHPVPLAGVDRQRAIVARIDELFAEIDDGEAALARARDDLATWRKALLNAAVTGELTADWRAANREADPGTQLLRQVITDRQNRSEAKSAGRHKAKTSPAEVAGEELPAGWAWAHIGDLFDVFVGATPSRADSSLWDGDVPWVSSGEVGFCRISDTREKINREALRGSAGRLHPPGTVMLGMIGEGKTRGQAAILDIEAAHNQNCASIRVSETPIPPEYVYLVLSQQYERTRLRSSGGNQPALNKERVKAIRIPLPGVSECRAIAEIYDEASEAIDAFSADRVLIEASLGTLRQSILAAAFRGELV